MLGQTDMGRCFCRNYNRSFANFDYCFEQLFPAFAGLLRRALQPASHMATFRSGTCGVLAYGRRTSCLLIPTEYPCE